MYEAIRRTMFIIVCVVLGMAPRSLWAGPKEEARKHYDRAIELVDDNQLLEAVVEFQRSYDLTKHFSVLYNIGQVYASLAKPVEAIAAYESYLASGGKKVPSDRRREVEQELAKQKTRIASLTIRIEPSGATIRVDGNIVGTSPLGQPLVLKIGDHVVVASADNFEGEEVRVTLAGEDHQVVDLKLKAKPEKSMALSPSTGAGAPASTESTALVEAGVDASTTRTGLTGTQTTGVIAGIAGLLGAGAGTVFWILAKNRNDEAVSKARKASTRTEYAAAETLQGQAEDFRTYGYMGVIAGGALVALGATLYLLGSSNESTTVESAQVRLLPSLGNGYAGLSTVGTW
jgi:hypothetical protein